jgi:hypothetical protein
MAAVNPSLIAGGNISPSRFITLSTTENATALQAGAGARVIGVATEGAHDAPITGSSALAAADGDYFRWHPLGDECLLDVAATITAGDVLKSDANGKGVVADTDEDAVGAIALEAGASGEKIRVLVWLCYFATT